MITFFDAKGLRGTLLLECMTVNLKAWTKPTEADAIEVSLCQQDGDVVNNIAFEKDPGEGVFWSVYYHDGDKGGVQCVADFDTQRQAEFFGEQLAEEWGVDYGICGFSKY